MRLIAKAFVISLFVFSANTFAAEPSSETFAKNIANASSWKQLLGGFKASLNPLVAKELATITQDLPYPTMRMRKGRLIISNENGEHLTVLFFQKNGAVTLNGKEFEIRPLATSAAEVDRIVELLKDDVSVSVMDLMIPSAHAAGLGMSKNMREGVAAAAYASSMAWKGAACKQEDISKELNASCSLMAVSVQSPTPIYPNKPIGPNSYFAVDLVCPINGEGHLKYVLKNQAGWTSVMSAKYSANKAVKVKLAFAEKNADFQTTIETDIDATMEEKTKAKVEKIKSQCDSLLHNICLGSKTERERYKELLMANKSIFPRESASNSSTENKSSSGL